MATVSNVKLSIEKGGGGSRRAVKVTYKVCYTSCEILAGSVFVAEVRLRGDDPLWDDNLVVLSRRCIKAEKGCPEYTVSSQVSRSTLDEDGDTVIIIGGVTLISSANRDEVYARVTLTPYEPSGDTGNSNVVTGQWGAAGRD